MASRCINKRPVLQHYKLENCRWFETKYESNAEFVLLPEHVSGAENGAERVKNSGSGAVSGLLKRLGA